MLCRKMVSFAFIKLNYKFKFFGLRLNEVEIFLVEACYGIEKAGRIGQKGIMKFDRRE